MRLAVKLWLGYLAFWLVVGGVVGGLMYGRFPFLLYFAVPFALFGILGAVPASYGLLWMRLPGWTGRLILTLVYAAVIAAVFRAGPQYRSSREAPRDQGPYLTWADDPRTTVTVCWTTAALRTSHVSYTGPGRAYGADATSPRETHYHHVTLRGLRPGAQYTYRVPDLGPGEHTFRTAPAGPEDFSLLVYGDTRVWAGMTMHGPVVRAMLRADARRPCAFVLNTGDIVENPGRGYGWQWNLFADQITPLADTRPYLVSLGNHEARGGTEPYDRYLDYGTDDYWYSFDYAGVHFVALSTQHDTAPDSPQHRWLVADLERHAPASRFVVVWFHKPLVTYDPRESYHNLDLREHLQPVLEQHGVDVVFVGHVHAYERHNLGRLYHVVTGGGGVLLWHIPATGEFTVKTETTHHFCRVDVVGDTMRVRALRLDDSVIDEFEVRRTRRPASLSRE